MASRAAKVSDYPSLPALRRAVEQARELGLDPVGYEVAPGGTIRILGRGAFVAANPASKDEFEEWENNGQL